MGLKPSAVTLAEFFGMYRALVDDGLTSNAQQAYARARKLRLEPTLGPLPLTELRPLVIANARTKWTGAEQTKNEAKALLSEILGLAVMDGLLSANPASRSPVCAVRHARRSGLHARSMIYRCGECSPSQPSTRTDSGRLRASHSPAPRLGELVGLRWGDVDEQRSLLTVRRTFSPDGHGRLIEHSTKSGKARQVPIIEELAPWLDASRAIGREHVFTGKLGGPFDSGNLARALRWHAIRDQIITFPE